MSEDWTEGRLDRRKFIKTAGNFAGGVFLGSALPTVAFAAKKKRRKILHVFNFALTFKSAIYYPTVIAQQRRFFEDENVKVGLSYGLGGGDLMRLLAAGRIPVNGGDAGEPMALARSRGANVSAVFVYMVGNANSLVAQSGIKSYADLPKGEVLLGVSNPTAGSTIAAKLMLKKAGIPLNRVTIVSVGGSKARFAAVLAKKVHVAPSVLSVALRAPFEGLNILGHGPDAVYPTIFTVHSVNNDWVNQNAENYDLAVRNTTAALRGLHWGFTNKEGMMKWLMSYARVPKKVVKDYYRIAFESSRPLFSSDGKLLKKAWENTFESLKFAGQMKNPSPKISDLNRTDIYEAALKRLKKRYDIELPPSKAEKL